MLRQQLYRDDNEVVEFQGPQQGAQSIQLFEKHVSLDLRGKQDLGQSNMRNRAELGSAMAGLAVLVVSGIIATPAGAALTAVKAKPPVYRYEAFWVFPPGRSPDVDKISAAASQKVLAPALADGGLVGYGDDKNLVYSREDFTHSNWWQATSLPGVLKLIDAFDKRDGSNSPQLASATEHWGRLYGSRYYNWKAGSWRAPWGTGLPTMSSRASLPGMSRKC